MAMNTVHDNGKFADLIAEIRKPGVVLMFIASAYGEYWIQVVKSDLILQLGSMSYDLDSGFWAARDEETQELRISCS